MDELGFFYDDFPTICQLHEISNTESIFGQELIQNDFISDPSTHLFFGSLFFAYSTDEKLRNIDFNFPHDLAKRLKSAFENVPKNVISPNQTIDDLSGSFSLLESTAAFTDKWEMYTDSLESTLEISAFDSTPRSSTPLCENVDNLLNFSAISDTDTQLSNDIYRLVPNSIFMSDYSTLFQSDTSNSDIFQSDLSILSEHYNMSCNPICHFCHNVKEKNVVSNGFENLNDSDLPILFKNRNKKTFQVYHNGYELSFSHIFDQEHLHLPKKSESGHYCQNSQCTLKRQKMPLNVEKGTKHMLIKNSLKIFQKVS